MSKKVDELYAKFGFILPDDFDECKGVLVEHPAFGMLLGLNECPSGEGYHPIWQALNGLEYQGLPIISLDVEGNKQINGHLPIDVIRIIMEAILHTGGERVAKRTVFHFTRRVSGGDSMETLATMMPPTPAHIVELYSILIAQLEGHGGTLQ